MKYTAIFLDAASKSGYSTAFFVTHHDRKRAWRNVASQLQLGQRLMFLIPGEQHVFSRADVSLTQVA